MGLILFTSHSDVEYGDYLSLSLFNSFLQLSYSLGSGRNTLSSSTRLDLNAWYFVTVTLQGPNATLLVDGQIPDVLTAHSPFTALDVQSNVFLGGYSSFMNISTLTNTSEGFNGSISHFEIDGRVLDLISEADFGYGVRESGVSPCAGNPCLNGGQCMEMGPSFICQCTAAFTGLLCGSMVDLCEAGANLCAEGSTCVTSEDGLRFTCLCPVNRGGDFCNEGRLH